jgi:predicted molibdopterin-dependent oxidoreductase YjgC
VSEMVVFTVDGDEIAAPARQSIAAALLTEGRSVLRNGPAGGPRGLYCGIGACFECRVHVEGRGAVLSCVTAVEAGMRVTTGWP